MLLETIHSPADVKRLKEQQLPLLCAEIRQVLMDTVAQNGGHLASNLGTVELTVALHRVFDSPRDKIVFDVGHQCYTHKLLTGRYDRFASLRRQGGLSGFTRPEESEHDQFLSGHSSTSVSSALGLSVAGQLLGKSYYTVAVIGDGALTGGMAYEALNNAGRSHGNRLIVILNDNKMSISGNVGAMARHLADIRSRPGYFKAKEGFARFLLHIPLVGKKLHHGVFKLKTSLKNWMYQSTVFEELGFSYIGPIDGHDLTKLQNCLDMAKHTGRPALIHLCTKKGKGYAPAEQTPKDFHGVASGLDLNTGESKPSANSFSHVFGQTMVAMAKENPKLCAITAAMCDGTGLSDFANQYPTRFFDVGIAEQHALTFAAGLAKGGMIPVVAIYSSFLQRGYDQLVHDIAAQGLKVIVCVDRVGVVGEDGEMHHGMLDAAYLRTIPGAKVYSPYNFMQLKQMLSHAVNHEDGLIFIRYPRGGEAPSLADRPFTTETEVLLSRQSRHAIVTYGRITRNCTQAAALLKQQGKPVDVLCLQQIKPLTDAHLQPLLSYRQLFLVEEQGKTGGLSQEILASLCKLGYNGLGCIRGVDDPMIPHGTVDQCLQLAGLDADSIARWMMEEWRE